MWEIDRKLYSGGIKQPSQWLGAAAIALCKAVSIMAQDLYTINVYSVTLLDGRS